MPLSKLESLIPSSRIEGEVRPQLTELLSGKSVWTFQELEATGLDADFLARMKQLAWKEFPAGKVTSFLREGGTMDAAGLPSFLTGLRRVYQESLHLTADSVIGLFVKQSQIDILFKLAPLQVASLLIPSETDWLTRQQITDFLDQIPDDFLIRDVLSKYLEQRPDLEFPADRIASNLIKISKAWWLEHSDIQPDAYLRDVLNQTGLQHLGMDILLSFTTGLPDPLFGDRIRRWSDSHPGDEPLTAGDAVLVLSGVLVPPVSSSVSLDFSEADSAESPTPDSGLTSVASLSDFLTEAIREEVRQKEISQPPTGFDEIEPHRSDYEFEPVQPENEFTGDLKARIHHDEPSDIPQPESPAAEEEQTADAVFVSDDADQPTELSIPVSVATIEPVEADTIPDPLPEQPSVKSLFDRIMEEPIGPARFEEITPDPPADPPVTEPVKSLFDRIMEAEEPISAIQPVNLDTMPDAETPEELPALPLSAHPADEPEQATLFVTPDSAGPVLPALEQMITENQAKLFIRYVFRKDEQRFYQAIHDLNDLTDWQEAKAYLDRVFHEFKVDLYSNEALEFTDIVYSRFN